MWKHFVFLLLPATFVLSARQKWYYTGKLFHNDVRNPDFEGRVSQMWPPAVENSEADADLTLSYGGILCNFSHYNETVESYYSEYLESIVENKDMLSFLGSWVYNMYSTRDYEFPLTFEIGLYDHDLRKYIEYGNMTAGVGTAVVISADEFDPSSLSCRAHAVVLSADPRRNISPLQHLWTDISNVGSEKECAVLSAAMIEKLKQPGATSGDADQVSTAPIEAPADGDAAAANIRIMTYNLWHTNPAAWLYQNPGTRWNKYWKRIRFFVNTILDDDPDVILLQEVRFDVGFSASRLKGFLGDPNNDLDLHEKRCVVSGSQIEQVRCMLELFSARRRVEHSAESPQEKLQHPEKCVVSNDGTMACEDDSTSVLPAAGQLKIGNSYQFTFQPAMSMQNREYPWVRGEEEGVAIIVKSRLGSDASSTQRISNTNTVLLPRMLNDASDDHQRVLLHAEVEVTSHAQDGSSRRLLYDVYTSHLSLSESARNRSFNSVRTHLNSGRGTIQVYGGDLNAESHEGGIIGLTEPQTWGNETALEDLWVSQEPSLGEKIDETSGFTFPTCKPVKRIDYLFYRQRQNLHGNSVRVLSKSVRIIGKESSADTAHLVNSRPDIGMMDEDSPLWASDHMALVADIAVRF